MPEPCTRRYSTYTLKQYLLTFIVQLLLSCSLAIWLVGVHSMIPFPRKSTKFQLPKGPAAGNIFTFIPRRTTRCRRGPAVHAPTNFWVLAFVKRIHSIQMYTPILLFSLLLVYFPLDLIQWNTRRDDTCRSHRCVALVAIPLE